MNPRVMVISHGHPDFSVGGGENAAYAQFRELRRRGVEALFVARTGESPGHAGAAFSNRTSDGSEVLFSAPPVDHFRHSSSDRRIIYQQFRALLERFDPTVVHFHHYVHLGLEMIREVRHFMPQGKIFLTLHEFLAMCHAQGQMLKRSGMLCSKAVPLDCHQCFPGTTPQEFFMRELFVKSFLNLCDGFISPSQFLRDRYVAWGLPAEKMTVVENGQPPATPVVAPAPLALRTRFVVLGQLSRLKGTPVVLEAARLLPKSVRKSISLEIHGSMQWETDEFKAELRRGLEGLGPTVSYGGPYRHADVAGIIHRSGWVIQPSIWWENSPLVIQEAFAAGRPVIASNIGGMAEKVADRLSGLHFRVGSASDLAARIEEAATTPGLWESLCAGLPTPLSLEAAGDALMAMYSGSSLYAPSSSRSAGLAG